MTGTTEGCLRSAARRAVFVSFTLAAFSPLSDTRAQQLSAEELADLSLEQLGSVEITSVSKKPERLVDAPASVFVITAEDIRRSGVTSLPETLRLAPNLLVARVDSADYAISSRGFNNSIGNKLLVLIDGRSVYTPLFSGVFWDAQDVMLEDVERIEVVSGPGATLWGVNAVNGVINIITRRAGDTQDTLLSGGVGNLEKGIAVRHGATSGGQARFRVYGKFFDRQNTERADGSAVRDGWDRGQVGFRSDWGEGTETATVQGDAYSGELEQAAPGTTEISGANLLGRWNRQLSDGSALRLQGYYDRATRDIPGTFAEDLDILDFELQHSLRPVNAHEFVWGGGYRYARDRVQNTAALAFLPANKILHWENVFAQDTLALGNYVHATLGVRLERNVYTGLEVLPSARIAWKPAPERLIWGSVSRAVRAPSRLDRELFVPATPPFVVLAGGPDFESEVSTVAEIGYRAQSSPRLSYSVTAFHHIYDDLRSIEPSANGPVLGNKMKGTGTGVEAWSTMQVTSIWRLGAGGFVLHQDLELEPDSGDTAGVRSAGNDPDYQWVLRSSLDLPGRVEFDAGIRHVAKLPDPSVPAYTAVDMRLGWRLRPDVELSLTAQNLFDPDHPEFGTAATRSELARSIYGKVLWRF